MAFWAVAQVHSQPRRINSGRSCQSRVQQRLADAGFETYQPLTKQRTRGVTTITELFPGYLFVRLVDRWWTVRWTPGVYDVLGCRTGKPTQLHDRIIEELRRNEVGGFVQLKKQPQMAKGQRVRVLTGQFRNLIGLYEGQTSREREVVLLSLLGRMVPVELAQQDRIETA